MHGLPERGPQSLCRRGPDGLISLFFVKVPMQSLPRPRNLPARTVRSRPTLRFTPTAWAKLLFLRDYGSTEVGGFGISDAEDLLLVTDFVLVPQVCSVVTVAFDDVAVAEYFDQQLDLGRQLEQVARIWIHTHPGNSAHPSHVDEETFERVFGRSDWAVMVIVACGGESYARMRFQAGPGGSLRLPLEVDFQTPFTASDQDAWEKEYLRCVRSQPGFSFPEDTLYEPRLLEDVLGFDHPRQPRRRRHRLPQKPE